MKAEGVGINRRWLAARHAAAGFEIALRRLARNRNLPLKAVRVTCTLGLAKKDPDRFGTGVRFDVELEGLDPSQVESLIAAARRASPNTIAGNVDIALIVRTPPRAHQDSLNAVRHQY